MSAGVQQTTELGVLAPPSRPRVVIRADLRFGLRVLLAVAGLGLPLSLLWLWLAPPEVVAVLVDPVSGLVGVQPLAGQNEHRFESLAIFTLLGISVGVLTGVVLWLQRQWRGPVVLIAAVLGALIGGWVAMRVGLLLADWRYPDLANVQPGEVVARAPVLESAWVLVAQPFGTAITYSLVVAWNGTDDLGRTPS